jgi:hypothetical protein
MPLRATVLPERGGGTHIAPHVADELRTVIAAGADDPNRAALDRIVSNLRSAYPRNPVASKSPG